MGIKKVPSTSKQSKKRVTLADVAKASGFSSSTASIVLNEAPLSRYVAASTKTKVQETAKRLGYRPDVFARSLRSQRSGTIGVLVIDLADPFCTLILQGIERKLIGTSFLPIIMDACNKPRQVELYAELMVARRVEGLITVANRLFFDISALERVCNQQLPTVMVGRDCEMPTVKSVAVDNEGGGRAAIRHLYALGHRDVAYIRGPRRLIDSRHRWKGIKRFAGEVGLQINENLIRSLPEAADSASSFDDSRRLVANLIKSGHPFTAILAFDDIAAYGAIRALAESGLRVPEDCSVIGFDDIPASALSTPGLTTICQPMMKMGEYAVDYILSCLNERKSDGNVAKAFSASYTMAAETVVRGSTAKRQGSAPDRSA
jgi:DNA-binding LacI/PurR family transcriptional regulator